MPDPSLLVPLLAALSFGAIAYLVQTTFFAVDSEADRRRKSITETSLRRRVRNVDTGGSQRRHAVADTLKEIEERQKNLEKVTLRLRIERAGLDITPNVFWMASIATGAAIAAITWMTFPTVPMFGLLASAFVGTFGPPRWILGYLTRRRQAKFLKEFAPALDIIIRGVKSGLPFNECLNIIARESPEPIKSEFQDVVEQQRVGVPLAECFDRVIARMPVEEMKFFAIVVGIQQKSGGNLSEALTNLTGVLRDRTKLKQKIKTASSEAITSAYVLGSLPFLVGLAFYLMSPETFSIFWTDPTGQLIFIGCGIWLAMGALIMMKMVNFKI